MKDSVSSQSAGPHLSPPSRLIGPPSVAGAPHKHGAPPEMTRSLPMEECVSFGNEIREVAQISRCLILRSLILDQMKTSLLPRSSRFLCGVCRCSDFLPRNGSIEDSVSRIQNDHVLIVVFLHTFRRNGKKRGKNRDPGVPKLY